MSPSSQVPAEKRPWKQVILRSVVLMICCGIPAVGFTLAYPPHEVDGSLYRRLLLVTSGISLSLIATLIVRDWYGLLHGMPLIPRWLYVGGLLVGIGLTVGMVFLCLAVSFVG